MAKEEDAKLPRINAALFMSPGGDKFYQLLHALSTHVIKQAILTENGRYNNFFYLDSEPKSIEILMFV